VVLVVFGFERVPVLSCQLISAKARGKYAFVKFTNKAHVLGAYVTCFGKKYKSLSAMMVMILEMKRKFLSSRCTWSVSSFDKKILINSESSLPLRVRRQPIV
jgi:hypothetical protein